MSDAERVFVASKEEVEEKAKKVPKKAEQAVGFLDETQQRAAAAYAAYIEAERQLEGAYKEQERQADKAYNEAVEQARKAYEGSVAQALRTRDEAERKAGEARNETIERTWAVFTKARK